MRLKHIILSLSMLACCTFGLNAQRERRDTSGTGTVDIISSFKPTLRDLQKLQFTAATPAWDSSRVPLNYRIPSQELSISYQPGTLKPLAYQADSNKGFATSQYIKIGYGSLRNPYASVALDFGEKLPLRFLGSHQSASGPLTDQKYSVTAGALQWQFPDRSKGEWLTSLFADRQAYHKYGYDTTLPRPIDDSIRQVFHQYGFQVVYKRKQPPQTGFYVEPEWEWKRTADRLQNSDMHTRLVVPIRYAFNDQLSLQLKGLVHWGRIKPSAGESINQSVYSLNPSVRYRSAKWTAHAGIRPSWDNQGIRMYPDMQFFWHPTEKPWQVRLQWSGELQRIGYRDLYTVNPWLWMPVQWRNQGRIDRSVQWQYDRRAHWVYELQAGYATWQDAFLFINDTSALGDGKSFQTTYADRMQQLYVKGKLSYRQADRWLIQATAGWSHYHNLRGADEAWGLLPFEWNLHATHRFANKIRLRADLYSWFAPYYLTKTGTASRTDGAFDLNLGAEMPINRRFSAWLQFNNLLNQSYSRWSQYPTYGFHFVGGVVFSPDKLFR